MTNNSSINRSRIKLQDRWTLKHLDSRQFNVINMVKELMVKKVACLDTM